MLKFEVGLRQKCIATTHTRCAPTHRMLPKGEVQMRIRKIRKRRKTVRIRSLRVRTQFCSIAQSRPSRYKFTMFGSQKDRTFAERITPFIPPERTPLKFACKQVQFKNTANGKTCTCSTFSIITLFGGNDKQRYRFTGKK